MTPIFQYDIEDKLAQQDVDKVIDFLENGGLCILPSDSSYILTGLITSEGVSKDIDLLLGRKGEPMSLAFGSIDQITEKMVFSNKAYVFFKMLTPGRLTFVTKPKKRVFSNLSRNCLYADGSIGVRLTESIVETQIADFFPIPSTPIRNERFKESATYKEAWDIIAERSTYLHSSRKIAIINSTVKAPGQLSTVVKEEVRDGYSYIKIIRKGAISVEDILKVAMQCKYKGLIEE